MRRRRHAPGQRREHGRGAAHRVRLQRLSAREHQHDERAGQVLAEEHRGDDGDAGEEIGAEIPAHETGGEPGDQGQAANDEGEQEWNLGGVHAAEPRAVRPGPAQREVRGDGQERYRGNRARQRVHVARVSGHVRSLLERLSCSRLSSSFVLERFPPLSDSHAFIPSFLTPARRASLGRRAGSAPDTDIEPEDSPDDSDVVPEPRPSA